MRPADLLQLALFAENSVIYAVYMAGYLAQRVFFYSLIALVAFCALRVLWRILLHGQRLQEMAFGVPAALFVGVAAAFVSVTMFRELVDLGTITTVSINESLYMTAPAVIALCVANTVSLRVADVYMTILLVRYVLYFALRFDLTFASVASISWSDSSSPFETSFAHDLLVVECYFLYRNKKARTAISMAFTMLGLKRASFILAPLLAIFRRRLVVAPPPRRMTLVLLWLVGSLSPLLVMWVYSPNIQELLLDTFGINLNDFTSGRVSIYELATSHLPDNHGFGWVNLLLESLTGRLGTVWNSRLHNETVRLYLEVGIIGLSAYLGVLVYMARKSRLSTILIGYTVFVLITSRLLTHMSFWIALFLTLAMIERTIGEVSAISDDLSGEVGARSARARRSRVALPSRPSRRVKR